MRLLDATPRCPTERSTDDPPPFSDGDLVITEFTPEMLGVVYRVTGCRPARHYGSGWCVNAEATGAPQHQHSYIHEFVGVDAGHLTRFDARKGDHGALHRS